MKDKPSSERTAWIVTLERLDAPGEHVLSVVDSDHPLPPTVRALALASRLVRSRFEAPGKKRFRFTIDANGMLEIDLLP